MPSQEVHYIQERLRSIIQELHDNFPDTQGLVSLLRVGGAAVDLKATILHSVLRIISFFEHSLIEGTVGSVVCRTHGIMGRQDIRLWDTRHLIAGTPACRTS